MRSQVGLPAPDAVLFLTLSLEEQESRGNYGDERYEKREMQQAVRDKLTQMQGLGAPWKTVDAGRTPDEVAADILSIAQDVVADVATGGEGGASKPLLDFQPGLVAVG